MAPTSKCRFVLICLETSVISEKEKHECQVFRDFASEAELNVDLDSIRSETVPLPDISCRINGKLHYFELTRVSDQNIANETGKLLSSTHRTGEGGVGRAMSYDDRQMLREAIERKTGKTYKINGAPFDLLIYYDSAVSPSPLPDLIDSTFRKLQIEFHQYWNKIWLYDWPNNQVKFDSSDQ